MSSRIGRSVRARRRAWHNGVVPYVLLALLFVGFVLPLMLCRLGWRLLRARPVVWLAPLAIPALLALGLRVVVWPALRALETASPAEQAAFLDRADTSIGAVLAVVLCLELAYVALLVRAASLRKRASQSRVPSIRAPALSAARRRGD